MSAPDQPTPEWVAREAASLRRVLERIAPELAKQDRDRENAAARHAQELAKAADLTEAAIRLAITQPLDRDDMLPLRTIVARMLGLDPGSPYTGHEWATKYAEHVKNDAARSLLATLVKQTNLLANELSAGSTDLSPTTVVRVDKVLDVAKIRGWQLPLELRGAASTADAASYERWAQRYQLCIDEGLQMPDNDYKPLPRGINKIAKNLGITRQALSEGLKAHIVQRNGR